MNSKNANQRDLNKLKRIKTMSIVNVIIFIVLMIFTITSVIIFIGQNSENESILIFSSIIGLLLFIPWLLSLVVYSLINIINLLIILTYNWKEDEMHDSKILWSVLMIIILGPIASLCFSIIWRERLSEYKVIKVDEKYEYRIVE